MSGARTPDDFLTWDCRTYPSLPWTINQFCATPTGCQTWPTMMTPYGQRFSPNWCQGTEPPLYCLEHPHLSSWKPTRYSGSMNAAFKLLVTSNAVRPTLCNLTNFNSVNVQKLSTSSNAQMTSSSWDITCKVIGGRAYFVLQLAWTPNIDYTAFGATFVGCDDSGPKQETKSGVPWPAPRWAVTHAGTSSIPNSAVIVRYRMPVSAAAGAHACGVGTGSYEPYEISNSTVFHASSLQAFGPATVGLRSTCPTSTAARSACGASRSTGEVSCCPRRAPSARRTFRRRVGQGSSRRRPPGFAPRRAWRSKARSRRRRSRRALRSAGRARASSRFRPSRWAGARRAGAHGLAVRS